MCILALSNVYKVTLPLAARSLCKQVSVVSVFAQCSPHWKTQEVAHNISPGESKWNCILLTTYLQSSISFLRLHLVTL